MIPIHSGVRVWIATGHTDMRRGMNGLALQIQEGLKRDPHAGDLFVFRGRRGVRAVMYGGVVVGATRYGLAFSQTRSLKAALDPASIGPRGLPRGWFDQGLVSRRQLMTVPDGRDVSPKPASLTTQLQPCLSNASGKLRRRAAPRGKLEP